MKKYFFLCLFTTAVLSCTNQKPKALNCKQFDPSCEMEKDYQLIRVLSFSGDPVDAYGRPLSIDQWYVRSTLSGSIFRPNLDQSTRVTNHDIEAAFYHGQSVLGYNTTDTVNINLQGKVVRVAILSFGDRYVDLYTTGSGSFSVHTKKGE